MCNSAIIAILMVLQFIMIIVEGTGDGSLPMWKTQLVHFRRWRGSYMYANESHACSMVVNSVQGGNEGGAMVSFVSGDTHFDLSAFSDNDIIIQFKQEAKYSGGDHFFDNFEFAVELVSFAKVHLLIGNITRPASKFSTIRLASEKTSGEMNRGFESSKLSVGLAVGISVFMFIVCSVIGVVILRWAIRKGYLRHVARSYKSFRNPHGGADPVSFENSPASSGGQQEGGNVNVHI